MNSGLEKSVTVKTRQVHELRFISLFSPGRAVAAPCDVSGEVDVDALSDRLRSGYLDAHALVGREYVFPTVQLLQ